MDEKLKRVLSQLKSKLQEFYGVRPVDLVLFGSHARGDADAGSDIDAIVVLKGPVRAPEEIDATSAITSRLSLDNDVVIARVFMDEERFTHRNGPLLRNVRKEGMPI